MKFLPGSNPLARELPPSIARRRVVLVGASNLTKGIGTVVKLACGTWGQPLEVHAVHGHGRSYGRTSSLLGRQLPAVLECGLWQALEHSAAAPTAAVVTDIGNDVLYGEPVEQIVAWVETCLDRLAAAGARTVVTQLPLDNLRTLSRARFTVLRTLFFPHCRLSLDEVSRRVHKLEGEVRRLAVERGCALVAQPAEWYGFDPIHIKWSRRHAAWREVLSKWSEPAGATAEPRGARARTLYLQSRVPERRRMWGIEQRGQQPAARLGDGTTVAIY